MKKVRLTCLILFVVAAPLVQLGCGTGNEAATVYVSPDGSDTNPGTRSQPLKTLAGALDVARTLPPEKARTILLHGGSYYETSVVLTPADSGLVIEAVPGETPVLYGGKPISGWERDGDFYAAALPAVKEKTWDFRSLVVNDEMRLRARYPKTGALTHLNEFDVRWMSTTGGGWERKPTEQELTTLKYREGDLGPWLDTNNAELTIYHAWDESVVGLKELDDETRTVTFSNPSGHPPGGFGGWMEKAKTYVVWNIRAGMTEPGQWYLDRTAGKLVYWPLPGEDMSRVTVLAPTTETVIRIEKGGRNITIRGLTVSCTTTPLVAGGFGAGRFDGALAGRGIDGCQFTDLTVKNVGGWGCKINGRDSAIRDCDIHDNGAGGIRFHGDNITVSNNHIHDIGVIYPSAIALWGGGNDNEISHNELHDTPYSAIDCSGERTVIEGNLFYRTMQVLNDGAAIYITFCKDFIIRGNIVRGSRGAGPAHAYYMDEHAENCIVEKNLAINTAWPTHNHMTINSTIRNNVFIDEGAQTLTFPRSIGMTFEKNILVAQEITFQTPTEETAAQKSDEEVPEVLKQFEKANGITSMPNNIIHSRSGKVTINVYSKYTTMKTMPLEPRDGTVFGDPLFVDPENGDYSFKAGSPAEKLGIEPIDVSTAGIVK